MRTCFRETLWFKYGHLDSEAAAELEPDEDLPPITPSLPIEDRYADTGAVHRRDSAVFGIHTGCTSALAPIEVDLETGASDATDMTRLARELSGFPRYAPVLVVVGLLALAGAALTLV